MGVYPMEFNEKESSLIQAVEYDSGTLELVISFRKYYVEQLTYVDVPRDTFLDFTEAKSLGKFYLHKIKPKFHLKKHKVMADKIIEFKIDVTKIKKEWLHTGEKGVYLNCTMVYNEEQDKYGNNGFVTQKVPKEVWQADKTLKGEILGNAKEFPKNQGSEESKVGSEVGKLGVSDGVNDDLPF